MQEIEKELRLLEDLETRLALCVGPDVIAANDHGISGFRDGLPALVVAVDAATGSALVTVYDVPMEIDISLIEEDILPDDVLLVRSGVALEYIDGINDTNCV